MALGEDMLLHCCTLDGVRMGWLKSPAHIDGALLVV